MTPGDIEKLNWSKGNGLLPVIIQDAASASVLMTGFVNREALTLMLELRQVVLYSRTRKRIWVKGEASGNYIQVEQIATDCDSDAVLVSGTPAGPVCHTGAATCFADKRPAVSQRSPVAFLTELEQIVSERLSAGSPESYTARLAAGGLRRIAQKVGEEALEVALAVEAPKPDLLGESADLIFHLIVLLKIRGLSMADVAHVLSIRHDGPKPRPSSAIGAPSNT